MAEAEEKKYRPKDVNGLPLYVGEKVYYARKSSYRAKGQMIVGNVTKITGRNSVSIGSYRATDTTDQVAKVDKEYVGN
jgi:ribosomal protein L35AE/L33A